MEQLSKIEFGREIIRSVDQRLVKLLSNPKLQLKSEFQHAAKNVRFSEVPEIQSAEEIIEKVDFSKLPEKSARDCIQQLHDNIRMRTLGAAYVALGKDVQGIKTSYVPEQHKKVLGELVGSIVGNGGNFDLTTVFCSELLGLSVTQQNKYLQERKGLIADLILEHNLLANTA